MVREIVRDVIFLGQKSTDATIADIKTAMDLVDTLEANRNACVGMAANMIGVKKRIIAINDNGFTKLMINPTITAKSSKFETEEGNILEILVSESDMPRVIGRQGVVANSIKTLIQAKAYNDGVKNLKINIDSF